MTKKIIDSLHSLTLVISSNIKFSRRQVFFVALLLLLAGTGLRCGYGLLRERDARDERVYIQAVGNMCAGNNSSLNNTAQYNRSSLMIRIACTVCQLGFSPENTLRGLNLVYSMIWLIVMFFLCRDVFDNYIAGLLGMTFAAFNPYSARMACQILREPLYILIFTLSLWCAVKFIKNEENKLYPIILGFLTVLGFFTRYEGIEIGLFLPLAVMVLFMQKKKQRIKRCVLSLALYLLAIGVGTGMLLLADNGYLSRSAGKTTGYYKLFTGDRWE